MNNIVMQSKESYLEGFEHFEKGSLVNAATWLRSIRRAAISRFSELGFPTIQDEDWRFTNVGPIVRTPFQLSQNGRVELDSRELERFTFPGPEYRIHERWSICIYTKRCCA